LRKEEVRLDEMLIELKDQLRIKYPQTKIEIIFPEMPEDPSALTITGEKYLLETAILNLLDNACKFSDGKTVTAYLLLDGQNISIKISDKGIGIRKSEMEHLTETFYRAENARTYSGSGIGLTLAEKIITLHGGSLNIASDEGNGTEVTVSFHTFN